MSNYEEFWDGTDPNVPHSVFAIQPPLLVKNGQIQIRWQTVAGKTYAMQYSTDLPHGAPWAIPFWAMVRSPP